MESELAANIFGTAGCILWSVQLIPQVRLNYQRKSTEGVSMICFITWFIGGVILAPYLVVTQRPPSLVLQITLFSVLILVVLLQHFYYDRKVALKRLMIAITIIGIVSVGISCGIYYVLDIFKEYDFTLSLVVTLLSCLSLAGGFIPAVYDIVSAKSVQGYSRVFIVMDFLGGACSILSLVFIKPFDYLVFASYSIVPIFELSIFVMSFYYQSPTSSQLTNDTKYKIIIDNQDDEYYYQVNNNSNNNDHCAINSKNNNNNKNVLINFCQSSLNVLKIQSRNYRYSRDTVNNVNLCDNSYLVSVDSDTNFGSIVLVNTTFAASAVFSTFQSFDGLRKIWDSKLTYRVGDYPPLTFRITNTGGDAFDYEFPAYNCQDLANVELIPPSSNSSIYTYSNNLIRRFELQAIPFITSMTYICQLSIPPSTAQVPFTCGIQVLQTIERVVVTIATSTSYLTGYTEPLTVKIYTDLNATGVTFAIPPTFTEGPINYVTRAIYQSPASTYSHTVNSYYYSPYVSTINMTVKGSPRLGFLSYGTGTPSTALLPVQGNVDDGMLYASLSLSTVSRTYYIINSTSSTQFAPLMSTSFSVTSQNPTATLTLPSFVSGDPNEITYTFSDMAYPIYFITDFSLNIKYDIPAPFGYSLEGPTSRKYTLPVISTLRTIQLSVVQYIAVPRSVVKTGTTVDVVVPKILGVDYFKTGRNFIITLKLSDDITGVNTIVFMNQKYGISTLANGVPTLGTFVFEAPPIPTSGSLPTTELAIYDGANNEFKPFLRAYDGNMNLLPNSSIFYDHEFGADNITFIQFIPNQVDTTYGPVPVSLLFNLTTNDQGVFNKNPAADCTFLLSTFSSTQRILTVTAKAYYHPIDKLFRCDVMIPQYTNNITVEYTFGSFYTQGVQSLLIQRFGSQASLIINSKNSMDHLPPYFTVFNIPTQPTLVYDPINGLKNGTIQVRSSISPVPYTFQFNQDTRVSGDDKTGVYQFTIPIDTNACKTQVLSIGKIILYDNGEWDSRYLQEITSGVQPQFSPFHLFSSPIPTTTVVCSPTVTDVKAPILTSFNISRTTVDVGSNDREVIFNLTATDGAGIGLVGYPTIYLLDNFGNSLIVEPTDYANTSPSFGYSVTLPFGFGTNDGMIMVSVYGLRDKYDNLGGYSMLQLKAAGYDSNITVTYSTEIPSIFGVTNLYSYPNTIVASPNDEIITIRGRGFGDNPQQLIGTIDYGNGTAYAHNITMAHHVLVYMQYDPRLAVPGRLATVNLQRFAHNHSIDIMPIQLAAPLIFVPKPTPCSPSSTSSVNCSANGQCTFDGCQCKAGWSGFYCESTVINVDEPTYNNTAPIIDIVVKDGNSSQAVIRSVIAVVGVRELTLDGQIVKEYRPKQWTLVVSTPDIANNNSLLLNYNTTLQDTDTMVNVTVEWFSVDSSVEFANQTIKIPATSTKISIALSAYPFSSILNTLQVVLKTSVEAEYDAECSSKEYGFGDSQDVEWMKLNIDEKTLWGQFIKRGIIDDRVTTISNQLVTDFIDTDNNNSSSSSNNTYTNTNTSSTPSYTTNYIGMNLPYYNQMAKLDPNFAHLINVDGDNSDATCKGKSSSDGLSTGQIAGIVAGCIVAGAVAVGAVMYTVHKRKTNISKKKMDQKMKRVSQAMSKE
ncbi:hypothetical protein DFA_00490 [Cavenderia fasciculata]|uniref:EGF-like domain-containing protein n=1 Tax=Cavenderia fasciculata TaxID=261658 RepID=F4PS31_CACFS|nr:uncharacterized protein DFA_00490 [Cavenderia fasciculata]EGG20629.1 hypothetical protein DFA_00490 [Cavenderia fasciculata]|eukprot:XP_004358479.1 hypothetical protein DFA_00490 [Cavenderia fasciculata]